MMHSKHTARSQRLPPSTHFYNKGVSEPSHLFIILYVLIRRALTMFCTKQLFFFQKVLIRRNVDKPKQVYDHFGKIYDCRLIIVPILDRSFYTALPYTYPAFNAVCVQLYKRC